MMHDPGPDGRRGTEDDIFDGGVIGTRRDGYLDLLDPQTDQAPAIVSSVSLKSSK